jgi:hypothetical protein
MGDYGSYRRRALSPEEEAIRMHQYWEEKYLIFMMSCVDGDKRMEALIDKAENSSKYWLNKYNAFIMVKE